MMVLLIGKGKQRYACCRFAFTFANRFCSACTMSRVANCIVRIPFRGTGNNTICKDGHKDLFMVLLSNLLAMGIALAILTYAVIGADCLELLYGLSCCLCRPLLRGIGPQRLVGDCL